MSDAQVAPPEKPAKPPAHYVDKKKFHEAMVAYKDKIKAAQAKGLTRQDDDWPRVDNYIGDCFVKIAKHLAYRYNFINYSYRDEMISDGIENCLTYADKYDADTYKNPFAYFTQIVFFAFVRRIQKEKKQLHTKYKYIESLDLTSMITQGHDDGEFTNEFVSWLKEQLDDVDASKREPKKPAKKAKVAKVAKVKKTPRGGIDDL